MIVKFTQGNSFPFYNAAAFPPTAEVENLEERIHLSVKKKKNRQYYSFHCRGIVSRKRIISLKLNTDQKRVTTLENKLLINKL